MRLEDLQVQYAPDGADAVGTLINERFQPMSQSSSSYGESSDACGVEEIILLILVNGDKRVGFT